MSSYQPLIEITYPAARVADPHGVDGALETAKWARDADRRKDLFLSTLAHELRNPLAAISNGLLVWPLAERDSLRMGELRQMMGRQVRQMGRLIEDLLDATRIAEGKLEMRKQRVEITELVNTALEASRPFIDSCGHNLTVTLPTLPVFVAGDGVRLIQVFGNLIHNAAKYTGRSGRIWVSVEREQDVAVIRVRDDGPGIPQPMLTRIFEMFTQLDQTSDRAHGGLGIGLTLVKTLVEMHEGSVVARSEGAGRGSEFTVRLPATVNMAG